MGSPPHVGGSARSGGSAARCRLLARSWLDDDPHPGERVSDGLRIDSEAQAELREREAFPVGLSCFFDLCRCQATLVSGYLVSIQVGQDGGAWISNCPVRLRMVALDRYLLMSSSTSFGVSLR